MSPRGAARLRVLASHAPPAGGGEGGEEGGAARRAAGRGHAVLGGGYEPQGGVLNFMGWRADFLAPGAPAAGLAGSAAALRAHPAVRLLPGPLHDAGRYPGGAVDVLREIAEAERSGQVHLKYAELRARYCPEAAVGNYALPHLSLGAGRAPRVAALVVVADPADAERVSREQLAKTPDYSDVSQDSLFGTADLAHWRRQRAHFAEAFRPALSLAKVFPAVVRRAAASADRLAALAGPAGEAAVDMSEFLSHEAMAQLLLGMFGRDATAVERDDARFRRVANGRGTARDFGEITRALLDEAKSPEYRTPLEAQAAGTPLRGPLLRLLDTLDVGGRGKATKAPNVALFLFAGHDTTANTMTWLLYELARHPRHQRRLQAEVDAFFARLGGRPMEFGDLRHLPFMTRCVMETLRLWPGVPAGNFRALTTASWVTGPGGARVALPAGTHVLVPAWLRHRSAALWGGDAADFNPDRAFEGAELWHGKGFAAANPATPRFSPFTFGPRDCIGKGFAQMEMRAILAHLLHRFDFRLAPPAAAADPRSFLGVAYFTMAPQDLSREAAPPRPRAYGEPRVETALPMFAVPRHLVARDR